MNTLNKTEPFACDMQEAVRLTGYSRSRLYQAISDGRLKSWRVGRKRMTSPNDLRTLVEADRAASEGIVET